MITLDQLAHWQTQVPWGDEREVAQDLVLSRLIIEAANEPLLQRSLAFKGGTCLHKLWMNEPWRYSKDLDYQLTEVVKINAMKDVYRSMGERVGFDSVAFKSNPLIAHVRMTGRDHDDRLLRIQYDVQLSTLTSETPASLRAFHMDSPWFQGNGMVLAVQPQDIIASKVIALYQRKQPRDLFDLWAAIRSNLITAKQVADAYSPYQPAKTSQWSTRIATNALIDRLNDSQYVDNLKELAQHAPVPYDLSENIAVACHLIDQCGQATATAKKWRRWQNQGLTAEATMSQWVYNNPLRASELGISYRSLTPTKESSAAPSRDTLRTEILAAHRSNPEASNNEIARQTGASPSYVSAVRSGRR